MHHLRPTLGPRAVASLGAFTVVVGLVAPCLGWSAERPSGADAVAPAAAASDVQAAPAEAADALQLALTLQAVGRLDACTVEALRHGYDHPEEAPAAVDLAARCLVQAGQWSQGRQLLWHPLHRPLLSAPGPLRWHACLIAAVATPAEPLPALCQADPQEPRLALLPAVHVLLADSQVTPDRLVLVQAVAASAAVTETVAQRADLQAWAAKYAAMPSPSPWVAAGLSAAVPGLGRVYLGRWQEGLTSLLLVAGPAWFSYGGFERDGVESVRGWLLATTSAVFYLGNVYGSWIGAETDRRKAQKRLREDVRGSLSRWVER